MDALDQDVQALKDWLGKAWRYIAQESHTRFDRREMRQQMKLVEEKLRIALQKVEARDNAARAVKCERPEFGQPAWRLLNVEGLPAPVSHSPSTT